MKLAWESEERGNPDDRTYDCCTDNEFYLYTSIPVSINII